MATQKRTSGTSGKKPQAKSGMGAGRASLKAAPQRRKKAPSRAGSVSNKSTGTTGAARKSTAARTTGAGRTRKKAGIIKKALKKGFAELAKVGS